MAINKEYTMIIDKGQSKLNDSLEIYTSDLGVSVYLNILDSPYIKLSGHEDLYAKMILKDGLGKQIKSDIVPVVNNTVIFNLDKRIMGSMTESGKYSMYIIIMDDKQNKKILPPVTMTVIESDLVLNELETSIVDEASINNTAIQSYGNELILFNVDGSYNRTIWVTGDVITTAKMNKIEKAISKMNDDLKATMRQVSTFDETKFHQALDGSASPIVISNLEKGFYIITGNIIDFEGDTYETQLTGENYFLVTYKGQTYSKVARCLNGEEEFKKYRYDRNQRQVYDDENNAKTVTVGVGSGDSVYTANITEDKHQFLHITSNMDTVDILLPSPDTFADIIIYMLVDGNSTVNMPTVRGGWNRTPKITSGKMMKLNLVYVNDLWYGFWEGADV